MLNGKDVDRGLSHFPRLAAGRDNGWRGRRGRPGWMGGSPPGRHIVVSPGAAPVDPRIPALLEYVTANRAAQRCQSTLTPIPIYRYSK